MLKNLIKMISLVLLLAILATTAASVLAAPSYQEVTCEKDYVVQADDWLSKIADKSYGDAMAWPAIFDATNAAAAAGGAYDAIADPDVIEVGQTLCLPAAADVGALVDATKAPMGVTGKVINMTPERFFPEGTTVDKNGNFYVGSMYEGSIYKAAAGAKEAEPFIEAGANGLVSVLGMYADDATGTLWVCSSDAGNAKLTGTAPVAVKAFDLETGAAKGSYDFPGGGFCNDITIDAEGNVYASDSWSPRVLRLPVGGDALVEWVNDPVLGVEQWSLNGLDIDQGQNVMYIVNIATGQLFRIPINADGSAGAITEIKTSQPLQRPDGLKVVAPNILATAESVPGGMSVLTLNGDKAEVRVVNTGLNGVATFALYQGSAWLVENQGDHFWNPDGAGPDATPPFRLVEVPLN
jgi:sugar lactone lactonase YvrE